MLELDCLQEEQLLPEDELWEKHCADQDLNLALKLESILWSKKSREDWASGGDRCSSFSHKWVSMSTARNNIERLEIDGQLVADPEIIKSHVCGFFSGLYSEPVNNRPIFSDLQLKNIGLAKVAKLE